jgi:hypothetical protein
VARSRPATAPCPPLRGPRVTPQEAPLNPDFPSGPFVPPGTACWVGPRHLAGDGGRLYDTVADALTALGWTALIIVRGRQVPDEAPEEQQIARSTVLHIAPDARRWAQWTLADEPIHLGDVPVAWQVSARADTTSALAGWSAYFTSGTPGEAIADFAAALDARDQPTVPLGAGPELVLDAVTAHGWLRDADQPGSAAVDPGFTTHVNLGAVPDLIQDGDPRTLTLAPDDAGPVGWQAWAEPAPEECLWVASFGASVPDDLVAVFASAVTSTVPVRREAALLPESTRDRLLSTPAD